ncbi:universal stress protein [Desulfosporosinus sp. BICA1-9]|uniref:universal stress protein n=1 Tax=Desulfosporosinus sp. BICA1-9 TaxID=1531958 RepID=UPI00054C566E|nr:universal stress protein [Desulfosporosinus sp. BICA1-9]KJS49714.1 MAG: universal stress protein [Peptococcaceae bacterium BRH_c23]KJS88306.1 MAG: universal stress protein [Desulfosporosinus sp. BICA1-9]HBW35977.1 universal stress protein [Desulfosporosinus sp.]
MSDSKFNVLLYSDGSQQALSAAVYTANLLKNMPNMQLTVVQVQESDEGSTGVEYNWKDTWPVSPTTEWMKRVIDESDPVANKLYEKILTKTNKLFLERSEDVGHQVIYSNPSISDSVDALLEYAEKKRFQLIIMGTRGLTTLKGLIFGCLAHNVLNRSPIPVLLVKKLPQEFIDEYISET